MSHTHNKPQHFFTTTLDLICDELSLSHCVSLIHSVLCIIIISRFSVQAKGEYSSPPTFTHRAAKPRETLILVLGDKHDNFTKSHILDHDEFALLLHFPIMHAYDDYKYKYTELLCRI